YFPYVAVPHSPFLHSHHPEQNGNAPQSEHDDHDKGRPAFSHSRGAKLGLGGRNPGRSSSVLQFTLDRPAHVTLMVYDVQGRAVRTLVDQDAAEGTFRAQWDGRADDGGDAGKGVFFARLTADGALVASRKVVIE